MGEAPDQDEQMALFHLTGMVSCSQAGARSR